MVSDCDVLFITICHTYLANVPPRRDEIVVGGYTQLMCAMVPIYIMYCSIVFTGLADCGRRMLNFRLSSIARILFLIRFKYYMYLCESSFFWFFLMHRRFVSRTVNISVAYERVKYCL